MQKVAVIETWYNQDLSAPVQVQYLHGNVFSQDNGGNLIGVNVYKDGQPAALSGTVSGLAIRADGATVGFDGTLASNKCSVTLPEACYAVPGVLSVVIKLTSGNTVTTLCAVVTNVYMTVSDTAVDPGTILPDITTLIAEIEAAIASIPADYTDLWACLAPEFSSGTSYTIGKYVTYDGGLYRFTANHYGTWNAADVTAVSLGAELANRVFIGRRNLTSEDDLDNITEPGTYGKSPNVSPANWAFASNHQGRLNVYAPQTAANKYTFVQVAFDCADNVFAYRTALESTWNAWVTVAAKSPLDALAIATAVVDGETISNTVPWMFGGIASGVDTDYVNRIKSDYIPIAEYDRITFTVDSGYMQGYVLYDASKTYITGLDFTTAEKALDVQNSGAKYLRLCMRNTGNTNMSLSDLRRMKAVAYRLNSEEISNTNHDVRNVRNVSDDITVGSWKIGYVYADGGIDITGQPNYVCTMCLQKFPLDVYLTPDAGYQITVRFFDETGTTVAYSTEWMTETFFIPANTYFIVNMSKTTPAPVGDNLQTYIDALHFRSRAVFDIVPPGANKKTKLAVLGDSISTYNGWIETGYNPAYYPTSDVTNVDRMWWKIVADELGITDISISAISQSAFYDYGEAMYPPMYDAGRIARIGTGGAPGIVFINAGTNDGFADQSAGIVYTADIPTLEALPNSTVKGIALTIRRLQAAYPAAKIVVMIPKQVLLSAMQTGYNIERVSKIADEIKTYAEMYGAWKVIDLRKCGINQSNAATYCGDGSIHPNAKGMRAIARYIVSELGR